MANMLKELSYSAFPPLYYLLMKLWVHIFGNSEKVCLWFKTPSIVFESSQPIELIGSLSGINFINDELIRIEHGVFI